MPLFSITIHKLKSEGFDFGLQDYPIFDKSHREELNKKILEEYEMEEIGQETSALFKFYLNRNMSKIMPYYNKLYEADAIKYNFADQYDLKEELTHEGSRNENENRDITGTTTNTGNSSSETESEANGNSNGNNVNIVSRPPQNQITISDIENGVYASNASYDKDNSNTVNTSNSSITGNTSSTTGMENNINGAKTGSDEYTDSRRKHGRDKTMTALIQEYKDTIINIDRMIVEDPKIYNLFYGVYY